MIVSKSAYYTSKNRVYDHPTVHEHHVRHRDVPAAVHRVGTPDAALEELKVELGPEDVGALLLRELHADSAE